MRFDLVILLRGAQHREVLDVRDAAEAKVAFDLHPSSGDACSAFVGVLDSANPTKYKVVSLYDSSNKCFEPFDQDTHRQGFVILLDVPYLPL